MNVLQAISGPAIAAGLIWLISFRLWQPKAIHQKGHWGGALALASGLIVAYVVLLGRPPLNPAKAVDWLPHVALVAAMVAAGQRWWGEKWFTYIPVVWLLTAVALGVQLRNKIEYSWVGLEAGIWIAGLSLVVTLSAFNLEKLADRRPGASMPMAMWCWCAMGSLLLVFSGSGLLGQIMGGLAAVFGAAVVLSWWNKQFTLTRGAMTVLAVLYGSLLMQGYFYAETPVVSVILAAIAPSALWWGERRKLFYSPPWKAAFWRSVYLAIPMLIALIIAGYYYTRTDSGGGDYYYY